MKNTDSAINYLPRLARIKILVMSGLDVVEHEDMFLLAKNKEDLDDTVEKYKNIYKREGEVFVRSEWLPLSYSTIMTNDLVAAKAKFVH